MATATVFAPALSLLLLLFTGAAFDVPLSLPPLPEDPRLAYIAPEKCLWYLATSGMAKADSKSKNHVEQMLAEEDVQRFVREVSAKLKEAFAKATPNDPVRKQLGEEVPKLMELLLTRPLCVYIETIGASPQGPTFRGGMALSLDARADEIKASLEKIEQTVHQLASKPVETNDGWHKLPLQPGTPVVQWSVQEKFLLVGVGENEANSLLTRLKTSKTAPEWLAKIRRELPIERPSVVHYTNLAEGMKLLQPAVVAMHGPDQSRRIIEAFGLQNVKYYASVAGLDGEDFASRAVLATDGKPAGLFALLENKPLAAEALEMVPADATFAAAKRVDPEKALELFFEIATAFQPPPASQTPFDTAMDHFSGMSGVHLRKDVVAALGDTWCVYNSPDDGGLLFTGLTGMVTIRDRDKLIAANDRLISFLRRTTDRIAQARDPNGRRIPFTSVAENTYRNQKIFFSNFVGISSPFAPAWCITERHLIVSLFPQAIKSHLDRQEAISKGASSPAPQSLELVPLVEKQLKQKDPPNALAYQNTPAFFKFLYPLAQIGAQFACSELQKNGIDLNIGMFPNARAIQAHLVPTVTSARTASDGIYMETRGSLPLGAGALPLAAGIVGVRSMSVFPPQPAVIFPDLTRPTPMPAASLNVDLAPGFADRRASTINLKRIGLGLLNFEDVKQTLPAAAQASSSGKPLLSWRVAILPFVEQQQLFNQFRLDEPWDSEHNKKLIEKMPDVYKAPGSKVAGEFKTVYQTVRGEQTAFPGMRTMRLRGITDGTSGTIMVVETADDKAVVWTKPDDFEPDDKNPIAGLVGLREGLFLASFCDGHVQEIPGDIEDSVLKALFTRNGGEPVDVTNLDRKVQPANK